MSTVIKYAVPCITENLIVISGYRNTVPIYCPNSTSHQIDAAGIEALDSVQTQQIFVSQNDQTVPVGGYFLCDQITMNIPTGSTGLDTNYDVSYPYNINAFNVTFLSSSNNIGDVVNVITIPDTPIGILLSGMTGGVNSLNISNTQLLNNGFFITITDGTNTDDLGEITSIDTVNGIITCSVETVNSYAAGSTILIGISRVRNFLINQSGVIKLGISKIGSAGLPAGKISRLIYTNNSVDSKTFAFMIELED